MLAMRIPVACAILSGIIAFAGCGNEKTGEVSGTVKVDGKLVDGSMTFIPTDGKSATAGCEIKEGKYSARVPVGTMKVVISVPVVVGKKKLYNTPNSPEGNITKELVPERYSDILKSELTLEVKSGNNPKDWDLPAQ